MVTVFFQIAACIYNYLYIFTVSVFPMRGLLFRVTESNQMTAVCLLYSYK